MALSFTIEADEEEVLVDAMANEDVGLLATIADQVVEVAASSPHGNRPNKKVYYKIKSSDCKIFSLPVPNGLTSNGHDHSEANQDADALEAGEEPITDEILDKGGSHRIQIFTNPNQEC